MLAVGAQGLRCCVFLASNAWLCASRAEAAEAFRKRMTKVSRFFPPGRFECPYLGYLIPHFQYIFIHFANSPSDRLYPKSFCVRLARPWPVCCLEGGYDLGISLGIDAGCLNVPSKMKEGKRKDLGERTDHHTLARAVAGPQVTL